MLGVRVAELAPQVRLFDEAHEEVDRQRHKCLIARAQVPCLTTQIAVAATGVGSSRRIRP